MSASPSPTDTSRARRRAARVAVAFLVATFLSGCAPGQVELHVLANRAREDHGASTLMPSPHAAAKAQTWAETMASEGHLRHSDLRVGMPEGFRKLGENVGRGPDVGAVHQAFLDSAAHRANLLDPDYRWIGTGAARSADGVLYVAVVLAAY